MDLDANLRWVMIDDLSRGRRPIEDLDIGPSVAADRSRRGPVASIMPLPVSIASDYMGGMISHSQSWRCEYNGNEYAAWWRHDGTNRIAVVGKRSLTVPNAAWSTQDVSLAVSSTIGYQNADNHNTMIIWVTPEDGIVHVLGNMHTSTLKYIKSSAPEDITSWVAGTMVGAQETSMTYPAFRLVKGTTLFFYREGTATNGQLICNRYSGGTWVRQAIITSNTGPVNFYPNTIVVRDGVVHMSGVWRYGATTNADVSYLKSADLGVTWTNSAGVAYTLPVTRAAIEKIETVSAAAYENLTNNCGMDVDGAGAAHIVMLGWDGTNQQLNYYTNRTGAWVKTQITSWTTAAATASVYTARPIVLCTSSGRVFTVYRNNYEERGAVWCREITSPANQRRFKLVDIDLCNWEPQLDFHTWRSRDELVMLCSPTRVDMASTQDGELWGGAVYQRAFAFIAYFDFKRVDYLIAGTVDLPRINILRSVSGPNTDPAISATTNTQITDSALTIPLDRQWRNKLLVTRAKLWVRNTTANGWRVGRRETIIGGANQVLDIFAKNVATISSGELQWTPWHPLLLTPSETDAYIDWVGRNSTGVGPLNIFHLAADLGELVC